MNHHQVKVTCSRDHVTLSHKLLAALLHRGIAMHCVLLEKFTTIQLQWHGNLFSCSYLTFIFTRHLFNNVFESAIKMLLDPASWHISSLMSADTTSVNIFSPRWERPRYCPFLQPLQQGAALFRVSSSCCAAYHYKTISNFKSSLPGNHDQSIQHLGLTLFYSFDILTFDCAGC